MKKSIAALALFFLIAPAFAFADGGIVHFDPYSDRWDYSSETNQQAFINFESGMEKMILSVGIGDFGAGKTMWIFPVPADPQKVVIDVVDKLPSLRGEEISEKARFNLDKALGWLQATQIYAAPFALTRSRLLSGSSSFGNGLPGSTGLGGGFKDVLRSDVIVYDHLEKKGISSEIVTARTAQGFDEYFSKKGLKMDSKSIPVLENYIGKEYSFVVSWMERSNPNISQNEIGGLVYKSDTNFPISSYDNKGGDIHSLARILIKNLKEKYPDLQEQFEKIPRRQENYYLNGEQVEYVRRFIDENPAILELLGKSGGQNQKGVFVSFPTEKIFFPLMPTSVYDSKIVPAEVRVMGHVAPEIFSDIKSYTKAGYYWDESIQMDSSLKSFYNGPAAGVKYTKIEINAPSKFFTEDLWIKNSAPGKTFYQTFLSIQPLPVFLILLVVCSVLSGLAAGWLLFKEWRNREGVKKFSLAGLANCFTILGVIALIMPEKTVKDAEDANEILQSIREKGYIWKRRLSLGLIIADLPFLLISIFAIPISLSRFFESLSYPHGYYHGSSGYFWLVIISFVPAAILIIAWFIARIKKEDRPLFSELNSKGYSVLTFQPKDRKKIWFVLLFTVLFLIISWLAVKLLMISLGSGSVISKISGF